MNRTQNLVIDRSWLTVLWTWVQICSWRWSEWKCSPAVWKWPSDKRRESEMWNVKAMFLEPHPVVSTLSVFLPHWKLHPRFLPDCFLVSLRRLEVTRKLLVYSWRVVLTERSEISTGDQGGFSVSVSRKSCAVKLNEQTFAVPRRSLQTDPTPQVL